MPNSASDLSLASADHAEICAICGKDAGSAAFCHYFNEGRRIVLCSPACAEAFLRENRDDSARAQERIFQGSSSSDYDRDPPWWR